MDNYAAREVRGRKYEFHYGKRLANLFQCCVLSPTDEYFIESNSDGFLVARRLSPDHFFIPAEASLEAWEDALALPGDPLLSCLEAAEVRDLIKDLSRVKHKPGAGPAWAPAEAVQACRPCPKKLENVDLEGWPYVHVRSDVYHATLNLRAGEAPEMWWDHDEEYSPVTGEPLESALTEAYLYLLRSDLL